MRHLADHRRFLATTSRGTGSSAGYAAGTLLLTVAALWLATDAGVGGGAIAAGAIVAWTIQAVSFAALVRVLAARRPALRVWAGGMAVRLVGFGALVGVGAAAGWPVRALGIGYGFEMIGLLLAEAAWLVASPPGGRNPPIGRRTGAA